MANRTVSVALVADVGQYQSSMVRAASATKTVGDTATTAGSKAQRGFDMAGRGAAILGTVLAGGVAIGLKRTIDLASDAEQSIGGVEAVFKGYAQSVIADSREADRALGLSANSYRELATVIGAQLKNAGVPMEELAVKTDGLITMGADLAAMFGGTTEEAVRALSSALKGEMDPIERYGISLNDAALKAEAAALGLDVMGGSLTVQQRAMAVMSLVTKQGADAIGAFGREQDTAAGRAARAAAQWENLQTAIGEKLLPVWSGLMDFVGTTVIPGLEAVGGAIGAVGRFMADNQGLALALATVLGVQLAGGIAAVTVAFNRMVLTPVVLGLSGLIGALFGLPGALATAGAAVGTFMAAVAPLLAVGAVVFAITKVVAFATAAGDAREEVAGMWAAVADARGTSQLDALAGVVDQIREKVAELRRNLADDGVWESTILGAFLTGALEDTKALEEYERQLRRAEAAQREANNTAATLAAQWGITTEQVLYLAETYGVDLTAGGAAATNMLYEARAAAQRAGEASSDASILTDLYAQELQSAADAASEAKKQTDLFKLSLDILTGATVSMIQVESAFYDTLESAQDALENATGAVLDQTGALNLQSEAGRITGATLIDLVNDANMWIATMISQGATAEESVAEDARLRQSFYQTALQMTGSAEAAQILTDEIYGIPEERETKIIADTAAAARDIAGVQGQLDGLKDKTVTIKTVYTQSGSFSGNVAGPAQPGLAFGGPVPGASPHDRADNVPIMATAGEFMQPRPAVRKYGMGFMEDVRTGRFPMELARGYADGGPIIQINLDRTGLAGAMEAYANAKDSTRYVAGYPTPSGGGSLGSSYQSLFGAIRAAFPQARLNSGYRPGDPGYHGRGKAADIGLTGVAGGAGNSFMAAVNQWLYDNHKGSLAELIYDGLGDNRPDVKNSRDLVYSAATQAQHRNHVHAAVYDQGGPLYPGLTLAYNGTGKTEWVSREFGGGGGGSYGGSQSQGRSVSHNYNVVAGPTAREIARAIEAGQRQREALAPAW